METCDVMSGRQSRDLERHMLRPWSIAAGYITEDMLLFVCEKRLVFSHRDPGLECDMLRP